jgi:hypothetical protein
MPQYFLPVDPQFTERRRRVQLLTEHGVQPPPAWTDLSDRLDAYLAIDNTAVTRLCDAIVTPPGKNPPDVAALRAMALAEQAGPQTVASVNNTVVARVQAEMVAAYEPVAATNYATIADQFDVIAADFTAAAATVDPETPSADMVLAPDDHRTAWSDAERHAHRLDATLIALAAAAQLAGTRLHSGDGFWYEAPADPGALLALALADSEGCNRRTLWSAWQVDTGRTRRWGAVLAAGATIRAHRGDTLTPYREPKPLQYKQEQIPGQPRGFVRQVTVDPEAKQLPAEEPIPGRLVSW